MRFDDYRPPERRRRRRAQGDSGTRMSGRGHRAGSGARAAAAAGDREMFVVPEATVERFDDYYGRPIVKAPPWEWPIAVYLVLGGVAASSALLGVGGQLTGRPALMRNGRIASFVASAAGAGFLVVDLGKPIRAFNMLRVVKFSSPMSIGSWILSSFALFAGITGSAEAEKLCGEPLPLPRIQRRAWYWTSERAAPASALLAPPLAIYTALLLSDTSNPTWQAVRDHLPFVFSSSAAMAGSGLMMMATPVRESGPARALAAMGVAGELAASAAMHRQADPVATEPLYKGRPGRLMKWAERLAIAGGVGTVLCGRKRLGAVVSGAMLLAASVCTRFGVLTAGMEAAKDPRYVVEPQRRRLAERRRRGIVGDSITTSG